MKAIRLWAAAQAVTLCLSLDQQAPFACTPDKTLKNQKHLENPKN